jgi:predicted GNAT family acetyltransferase
MRDPGEFMSTLKVDLYPEEVYTFTPRGKVIVLPRDATPIDFAYEIHSDIGNRCVGAKVGGRIVPLESVVKFKETVGPNTINHLGQLPAVSVSFSLAPGVITLTHTEVPAALRGQGIASRLMHAVLETARAQGLKVVPRCSFVAAFMSRHPEFNDLHR